MTSNARGMRTAGITSMRYQHVLPGTPGTWHPVAQLCTESVASKSAPQAIRLRAVAVDAGIPAFAAERADVARVSVTRSRYLR